MPRACAGALGAKRAERRSPGCDSPSPERTSPELRRSPQLGQRSSPQLGQRSVTDSGPAVGTLRDLYGQSPAAEVYGPSGRLYTGTSLCCLRPAQWLRRWAIQLVESKPFDPIILLTIVLNCATMAWESPLDPCCTRKAAFIDVCEWVYLSIFTVEMFVKILAYGFLFNQEAYLRDPWVSRRVCIPAPAHHS